MKKYVFKLEKILSVKNSMVEQKKIEVMNANHVVKEKESILEITKQEKEILIEERNSLHSFKINDIKRYNDYFKIIDRKIKYYENELIKAKKFLELKKDEYVEALREKRIIEKLKQKDQIKYDYEVKKEEEKIIDGLVSYQSSKDGGTNG